MEMWRETRPVVDFVVGPDMATWRGVCYDDGIFLTSKSNAHHDAIKNLVRRENRNLAQPLALFLISSLYP